MFAAWERLRVCLLAAAVVQLYAQSFGEITGTVTDPSGAVAGSVARIDFALQLGGVSEVVDAKGGATGIANTDPNFNTFVFRPPIEALQEYKVEAGIYSVEHGTSRART